MKREAKNLVVAFMAIFIMFGAYQTAIAGITPQDSADIQNTVSVAVKTGEGFLPGAWKALAPVLTAIATAITAAIIRLFEKRALVKKLTTPVK